MSVVLVGDELRLLAPRAGGVYSRWRVGAHAPGAYGEAVVDGLRRRGLRAEDDVLALGLGGGVVQGELLCHSLARRVLTVELDARMLATATRRFYPFMFDDHRCGRAGARAGMHVLLGDATNATLLRAQRGPFAAVVADIGPVYLSPSDFPLDAWRSLREQTRGGGTLVCNTVYLARHGASGWRAVRALRTRLEVAGWRNTSAERVRGLTNVLVWARSPA